MNILIYLDVNECELLLCVNNGICINNLGFYICDCIEGWKNLDCKIGKCNICFFDIYVYKC